MGAVSIQARREVPLGAVQDGGEGVTDMEKIISDVISAFDDWENNRCCPGEDWSDVHQSRDMVIALLKAQEPGLMTLSGVRNLKESTPVCLEDVDKKDVIGALFMRDYSGTKCVDFAIVRDWEFERVVADYMDYGVRWRCWTSRPTDAQREATPWN